MRHILSYGKGKMLWGHRSTCPCLGSGKAPGGSDPSVENRGIDSVRASVWGWGQCQGLGVGGGLAARVVWVLQEHSHGIKGPEARGSTECWGGWEEQLGHRSLERRGFGVTGGSGFMVQDSGGHLQLFGLGLGQRGSIGDFSWRSDMTRFEYCKIANVENIFMG